MPYQILTHFTITFEVMTTQELIEQLTMIYIPRQNSMTLGQRIMLQFILLNLALISLSDDT